MMGREFSYLLKNAKIEKKLQEKPKVIKSIKIQSDSKFSKHDILNSFISYLGDKFNYLTEKGTIKSDFNYKVYKKSSISELKTLIKTDLPKYIQKFINECIQNDYRIGFSYGNYKMYAMGELEEINCDVFTYEMLTKKEHETFIPNFVNEGDMIHAIDKLEDKYGLSLKNVMIFFELLNEYELGNIPDDSYSLLKDNKKIAQYDSVLLENILLLYNEEIEVDEYKDYYYIILKLLKSGHSIVYDV